jgi:predicted anti-sigma-YlaC factor YlaD
MPIRPFWLLQAGGEMSRWVLVLLVLVVLTSGCSVKKFAINKVGDAIASGGSTYESDDDLELVQGALPFGLKLVESLLAESPKHKGLLYAAAQGFTSYAYVTVQQDLDRARESDFDRAKQLQARAGRLYLRGHAYGMSGLEASYTGFRSKLEKDPRSAVPVLKKQDLPLLYWTAASLGLAISASRDNVALLARIPEVEALLARALELDEKWRDGALHEFAIVLASAKTGQTDYGAMTRHYQRALELSKGKSAGLFVTYAEAVAVPRQQKGEFQTLLERAISLDLEDHKEMRLLNELAQRRARWLLSRIDDLILDTDDDQAQKENQ